MLFLTHALVFQVAYEFLGNSDPGIRSSINELKETNYAFIIMILAYCEFRIMRAAGTDNSAGAQDDLALQEQKPVASAPT